MQASSNPQRICPLCGDVAAYDDFADLYYCGHGCDSFAPLMPDIYTLMCFGPSGVGKTPELNAMCDFYLRNGRPIIFLAFDDLTSSVRKPLNAYCQERLPEYEAAGLATLVDCYSSLAGSPSEEKYALKNRVDLNELSILVSSLMNEKARLGSPKVFLDSLTPLFNYREPQLVVQFVTSVGAKIKTKGGAFLFSLTSGTVSNEILTRLETTADFVDELRFTELDGRQRRESRWAKARGIRIPEEWFPFYIGAKTISMDVGWDDPAKYERLKRIFRQLPQSHK